MKPLQLIYLTMLFFWSSIIYAQNTKIIVGIAYKKMTTSSCAIFNEAVGYEYIVSNNSNDKISDLRNQVENKLIEKHGVNRINIITHTRENMLDFQIISYNQKIDSYPCTKKAFAVGFGNSASEASDNANKEVDRYCRNCARYTVVSY